MNIKATIFALCVFLVSIVGFAAALGLEWDKPFDSTAVGYRVYYGSQPGSYSNSISVSDTNSVILTNLAPNIKYYFAVKSINSASNESVFSKEISYTVVDTNVYVYLVFELKYGTNLANRTVTNINLTSFINPPNRQTYSGRLIITNRPVN